MNEEEVIEKCKIFIDLYNGDSDWDIQDTMEAIQALLILYNQEKEKNKKLEEVIDMMAEELIQDGIFVNSNVEDVKQYYFKKAGDRS